MITARQVAERARTIEENIDDEVGIENAGQVGLTIFSLLDVEPDRATLVDEVKRIQEIYRDHYRKRYGLRDAPETWAGLGFLQGVTYAVAAQRLREEIDG